MRQSVSLTFINYNLKWKQNRILEPLERLKFYFLHTNVSVLVTMFMVNIVY